ncbi:MAG TPA: hypothetical protein EYN66_06440, partial [Myxococcales bacterium]|nr:hypothetical protein [Myxococcales bacterium]
MFYLDWTDSEQRLSDQIIRGLCGCLVDRMGAFPVYTRSYSNNVETLWGTVEILETRGDSGVSYVMDSAHYYKDR